MKKLVQVQEVEGEGFMALLGERVVVFCLNYIYSGVLEGVNDKDILLTDAKIVYETGELCAKQFKDAQSLPSNLYVRLSCVESYYKV
jgi:hypothetical protein